MKRPYVRRQEKSLLAQHDAYLRADTPRSKLATVPLAKSGTIDRYMQCGESGLHLCIAKHSYLGRVERHGGNNVLSPPRPVFTETPLDLGGAQLLCPPAVKASHAKHACAVSNHRRTRRQRTEGAGVEERTFVRSHTTPRTHPHKDYLLPQDKLPDGRPLSSPLPKLVGQKGAKGIHVCMNLLQQRATLTKGRAVVSRRIVYMSVIYLLHSAVTGRRWAWRLSVFIPVRGWCVRRPSHTVTRPADRRSCVSVSRIPDPANMALLSRATAETPQR